jgi:hypothetical protein
MKTETALKCLAIAGALSIVMVSSRAEATSCVNDIDCPEPACGGQVCDYNKGMTCQPAGGATKGSDGWCTTDSDCKCMGMGATCVGVYCSFTTPPAGGSGGANGGSGGSGGASATGGSSGSGGASASGGTTGASGGATPTGTTGSGGAASGPTSSNSSGGCSVGGSGSGSVIGILVGLSVLGLRRFRRCR